MPTLISGLSYADLPGVTLSTNSEVLGLGVRSLLTPVLADVWRTGPGAARELAIDLGTLRGVQAVVLYAPRDGLLPEYTATISGAMSATSMGGTDAGNTFAPLAMPLGYWCWVPPAVVAARYVFLSISSAQPYLQFGRLWVAGDLRTERNLSEGGYGPAVSDAVADATRREVQVTLPGLSQSEADQLEDIAIRVGTQRQVLVIPRLERADRTAVIGKFTAIPAPKPRQAWQSGRLHTATLALKEDR